MMRFIDLHCDTLSKLYADGTQHLNTNTYHVDIQKLRNGECFAATFAVFLDEKNVCEQGLDLFDEWNKMLKIYKDELALWQDHLLPLKNIAAAEADKMYGLLSLESCGFVQGKMERLEDVAKCGCKMASLTWNYENCMGYANSSNSTQMAKGLKALGLDALAFLNEKNIIIDISHLSDGGAEDVFENSKMPVVASHSNARAVCKHPRNLSDSHIRKIAQSGGVIGINFFPEFLTTQEMASMEHVIAHIDYIMRCGGQEVVALGSDYDGIGSTPVGLEDVSKMQNLYGALKDKGFTEKSIEKLFYQNALRVLKEYGL